MVDSNRYLPSQPVAIILAHCDDELFLYPLLKYLLPEDTYFFFLTASCRVNGSEDARRAESLRFLMLHGFLAGNIYFIGEMASATDGELYMCLNLVDSLLNAFLVRLGIKSIISVSYEGGHHDHDACFILAHSNAVKLSSEIFSYPLYNSANTLFFRVMDDAMIQSYTMSSAIKLRYSMNEVFSFLKSVFIYKSQWRTFLGLLPGLVRNVILRRNFTLRKVEAFDWRTRAHSGELFYERRFKISYSEVSMAFENFLKRDGG